MKPHFMKRSVNKSGLALAEALVAISTLIIGTFALGTIITNALSSTAASKDYLLAHNLIAEAVEAVKNLRDTNWLLRPNDRTCWLVTDPNTIINPAAECDKKAAKGNYTVSMLNNQWTLQSPAAAGNLDLASGVPANYTAYQLYIKELANYDRYVHEVAGNTASRFYRSVNFQQIDNNSATMEVKIQWKQGAKTNTISRHVTIFNYL